MQIYLHFFTLFLHFFASPNPARNLARPAPVLAMSILEPRKTIPEPRNSGPGPRYARPAMRGANPCGTPSPVGVSQISLCYEKRPKSEKKRKKTRKNLHMSKICSIFAPKFDKISLKQ